MNNTTGFPSIAQPDSKKDKAYHEQWTRAIITSSFTSSWTQNYQVLEMLYKYFLDGSTPELTGYLQTAPDGSSMPAIWMSLNSIKDKLETLIGEMEERGEDIRVRALNKEAISRRLEEKERLRVERRLRPIAQYAEQTTGIPLQKDEYIPETDRELDDYIDLTFKDKAEVIMEAALKFIAKYSHWDEKKKALFRDVLIANRAIVKNEIKKGVPQSRRVDPLKFIFDVNATDDMLSDSTYFGEVEYMPMAAAAEQYGLTLEELENVRNSYNEFMGMSATNNDISSHFYFPGNHLRWFKIIDGTPRCLVFRACWRDYKTLAHKNETVSKHGVEQEFFQDITDNPKEQTRQSNKDKIVYNKIECWRQATIIGGAIVREWGECPNQGRDLSKIEVSEAPYKVWIPNFLMGRSVSKEEQLVGLQLLKDIAMYHVQLAMARSAGKVLVLDEAMIPEGWTKEQVTSHIKASGIAWFNSKEYMMSTGASNIFKDFDLTLSESVGQYFTIMQYLDSQISLISGVTPERQGIVQGSSQAVGVTQAALVQSNLVTAPYFRGFERFCGRVLNHQAKLVKVAWAGKEVFAPIIGDTGIDFLKEHIDLDLDEFGVFVEALPPALRDRQILEETLNIYLQVSQGDLQALIDVMNIRLEPDTRVAVRKLQRLATNRQKLQMAMQQEQAQQEQAAQERELQAQQANQQVGIDGQLALQGEKNKGNLQKTLVTSRTKLNSEKLRMLQ